MNDDDDVRPAPASQTLSRGVRILEILADTRTPMTIDELAGHLDVHRSIAYRLLRTLEDHRLVVRDAAGRAELGPRMAALAAGVASDLHAEALPELTQTANDLGMTSFVAVLDGQECITLASVEPRHAVALVAQHPGTRHPVTVGAPGKAILSQLPPDRWPVDAAEALRTEVADASARGFARSHDEVIPGLHAVAVPLALRGRSPAAVAAVYLASAHTPEQIAARLHTTAEAVRAALGL